MEFRYSFVFWPICWENTFSFFRQKSINMAAVTEQTTEAFDWQLIGFIQRGRIHWNFFHSKSMVWYVGFTPSVCQSIHLSRIPCPLCNSLKFWMDPFHIRHKWSQAWEGVSHTMTFDLWGGGGTPSLRVSRYAPRFCPPFSASGRSFCPPKFDLVYHFIQILLGPISKPPIFSM